ncbi:MAG: cytochrome c family protein [Robiginitomaculum sp.]
MSKLSHTLPIAILACSFFSLGACSKKESPAPSPAPKVQNTAAHTPPQASKTKAQKNQPAPKGAATPEELGKKVFKKCAACHTTKQGAKHRVGPNLHGVFGRKAGSTDGFVYSSAMKDSGITWNEEILNQYLIKPKALVHGTTMAFFGLKKEEDRKNIIAYLKTVTGAD